MLIVIKILGTFLFWFAWGFFSVLVMAITGGAPGADIKKAKLIGLIIVSVPVVVFYLYRLIRYYSFSSGSVFVISDLLYVIVPAILTFIFAYNSD